ncbi:MAG: hypothetical protein KBT29_09625 [Prevotellaceae bacterium]|nr:hypothetical protein [Candidatus Minthosoma caballi]
MANRFLYILYLLLVATMILSCNGQHSGMKAELDGINAMAEADADSAARMLSNLRESMKGAPTELVMYYDLLKVKTSDKRKVRHTSDTLICRVAEFYEREDEDGHLPEAYYYVGRANSDMNNSEKALFYFYKAMQCDSSMVTNHLRGRIYAQMGYIYLRNWLFEDAKNMQEMAYFYCKEEGDTLGMRYCKEDISTISMLEDSLTVDSDKTAAILLKVMQIKEKVKADKLARINSDLQNRIVSSKDNTISIYVWIGAIAVAVVLLFVRHRSKQKVIKKEVEQSTTLASSVTSQPISSATPQPAKKQFYDKEINEVITSRVSNDKVLKPADWKLIEERLTESFPNFKDMLYSHINLSETEYRICVLIKLEVTPSNMAKLLALSNSSVSQIRLRLQHKVFNGEGSAKDWDNYVLSL